MYQPKKKKKGKAASFKTRAPGPQKRRSSHRATPCRGWCPYGWHLGPPYWPPGTSGICSQRKCRQGGPGGAWNSHRPRVGRGRSLSHSGPAAARASPAGRGHSPDVGPEGHRLRAATGQAKAPWLRQAALEVCVTGESTEGPTGHWLHDPNNGIQTMLETQPADSKRPGSAGTA